MTLAELKSTISSISTFANKVTYRAWPVGKAPDLPFICYLATDTDNFAADNKVYHVIQNVDVELYTALKDEAAEGLLEEKFAEVGLVWEKTEDYLDDEDCYEVLYEITL